MRFAALVLAGLIVAVVAAPAAQSKDLKPAQIIDRLNKERAALDLPPTKLSSKWTKGCKLHNRWQQLNNTISHEETRGSRGYTPLGAQTGESAILSYGTGGWAKGNPWKNAPFHLVSLYNPGLESAGVYDSYKRSCLEFRSGTNTSPVRPDDQVWTYPADGRSAPYLQWAFESPATPQEVLGISARTKTGPNILVFMQSRNPGIDPDDFDSGGHPVWTDPANGYYPLNRIVSASLVEEGGGPVRIKTLDQGNPRALLNLGEGVVLPVKPLKRGATYQATVVVGTERGTPAEGKRELTHTWSFKTNSVRLGD